MFQGWLQAQPPPWLLLLIFSFSSRAVHDLHFHAVFQTQNILLCKIIAYYKGQELGRWEQRLSRYSISHEVGALYTLYNTAEVFPLIYQCD